VGRHFQGRKEELKPTDNGMTMMMMGGGGDV
jgi:hypothetical protein